MEFFVLMFICMLVMFPFALVTMGIVAVIRAVIRWFLKEPWAKY